MDDSINRYRKSSYSGGNGGECIEVADGDSRVMVRDTKQAGQGPVLTVGSAAWRSFMAKVKADASLSSSRRSVREAVSRRARETASLLSAGTYDARCRLDGAVTVLQGSPALACRSAGRGPSWSGCPVAASSAPVLAVLAADWTGPRDRAARGRQ
jgi:hypothetical protein